MELLLTVIEGNSIPNRIHADGVNEGEEDIIPLREKYLIKETKEFIRIKMTKY